MNQQETPLSRLADALKYLLTGRVCHAENSPTPGQVPGGPFVAQPGPANLTLGKARLSNQAILEPTEQVTIFGFQGAGAAAVQNSLVAQQIARKGAYVLFDVVTDTDRRDMLAHLHQEAGTVDAFRVLDADHPSQSHTYNPLARGTAAEVAHRIVSAFCNCTLREPRMSTEELLAAEDLVASLVQALRDRDGVAQFSCLHQALDSLEGLLALVSATRLRPATRTELDSTFAPFRTADPSQHDLSAIRKPLAQLMRLLPMFSSGKLGQVLNVTSPEIDLLECLNSKKGVFVMLPVMGKDLASITLGRLVMADLSDALKAKQALGPESGQPGALVVSVETPCCSTGNLLQTFAAAKAAGVSVVAGVASFKNLEHLSQSDQEALLNNDATKVFFGSATTDSREALWSFGHRLAIAGGHGSLPGLVASLANAPSGEGFIARVHAVSHLAAWPQTELPGGLRTYHVPQRQAAPAASAPHDTPQGTIS